MATRVKFEEIVEFLRKEGINISIGPQGTVFSKIEGKHGSYRLTIRFMREKEVIVIYVEYTFVADSTTMDEALKLSADVNWGLLFTTCEVDAVKGNIRFRSTILTDEAEFNSAQFSTILATSCSVADNYSPVFKSVIYGGLSAKEALSKVQIFN